MERTNWKRLYEGLSERHEDLRKRYATASRNYAALETKVATAVASCQVAKVVMDAQTARVDLINKHLPFAYEHAQSMEEAEKERDAKAKALKKEAEETLAEESRVSTERAAKLSILNKYLPNAMETAEGLHEAEKAAEKLEEERKEAELCKVCMSKKRDRIFIECGHVACCSECAERCAATECPICKRKRPRVGPVFFP